MKNGHGGLRIGAGRPKGAINKVTRHVRDNLTEAFSRLGGVDGLVKWAESDDRNRAEFYKIYSRLLPLEKNLPDFPESSNEAHVVMVRWAGDKQCYQADITKEAYENQDKADLIYIKTAIDDS